MGRTIESLIDSRDPTKTGANMHGYSNGAFRKLVAAVLVVGQLLATAASSADEITEKQLEKWAKTITNQNPRMEFDASDKFNNRAIKSFAESSYQRMPRVTNYQRIRVSRGWGGIGTAPSVDRNWFNWNDLATCPAWKGVFLGRERDPIREGMAEPLGIPTFEFEPLDAVPDRPQQVKLTFGLADGTKWSFVCCAGVLHPATAIAIYGRPGLFTLTAPAFFGLSTQPAIHPLGHNPQLRRGTPIPTTRSSLTHRLALPFPIINPTTYNLTGVPVEVKQ